MTSLFKDEMNEFFGSMHYNNDGQYITAENQYNNNENIVTIRCAGMNKDNSTLALEGNILTLKVTIDLRDIERKYRLTEGFDSDRITSFCKDGILKITIPHKQEKSIHKIPIK